MTLRIRNKGLRKIRVADIVDNEKNFRTHGDGQRKAFRATVESIGFYGYPDVFEDNGGVKLIDGHLRKQDLIDEYGEDTEIEVNVTDFDQREADIALATHDPLAGMADTDLTQIAELVDDDDLAALLDEQLDLSSLEEPVEVEDVEPQISRADELQAKWKVEKGQVWSIVGKQSHRLMCGDCRDTEDTDKLIDSDINVAFTSPPYASQRKYDETSGFKPIHPDDYVEWFEAVQDNVKRLLADDGSWFVNIKEHCEDGQRVLYVKDLTLQHVRQWGWRFVDEMCWTKSGVPGKWSNRFKNAWESIFHFTRTIDIKLRHSNVHIASEDLIDYHQDNTTTHSGFISGSAGVRREGFALPSNVLTIYNSPEQTKDTEHVATFPIALPSFFVKAFSDESDAIYDPFLGSGTTMLAAEQLNRRCYGMEISPKYCSVVLERMTEAGCECELTDA